MFLNKLEFKEKGTNEKDINKGKVWNMNDVKNVIWFVLGGFISVAFWGGFISVAFWGALGLIFCATVIGIIYKVF